MAFEAPSRIGRWRRRVAALAAVLGDDAELARRAAAVGDWHSLLAAAFAEGLGGLAFHALERAGIALPAATRNACLETVAHDRLWHRRLARDLDEVAAALAGRGVRPVVLKGPILAERLYPEPALRPVGDLDFLISPGAYPAAAAAVAALHYRRVPPGPTAPPEPHATRFEADARAPVELHTRASSGPATTLDDAGLLARAVAYRTAAGREVAILAPADELLYLAVHAARHRFSRLAWLWELGTLLERQDPGTRGLLIERARGVGVERAVAAALAAAGTHLELRSAAALAPALARGPRHALAARVARLAPGAQPPTSLAPRAYRVLCERTFQSLLAETPGAAWRHLRHGLGRSLRNLLRSTA